MGFDITDRIGPASAEHRLAATPGTCVWGYIDRDTPPVVEVNPGDIITVEAVTHHAGDAPDLLMDDGIRAIWDGIPEAARGPGVHLLTGPIAVRGAMPGDTLIVRILDMWPRLPYGSNCGTAIEASLTARIQVWIEPALGVTSPLLETADAWFTHGFGSGLDEAMRMAAKQMLSLMQKHLQLSADDAYSLASVAMDLGVTQVVDSTLGCHAGISRAVFDA